MADAAASNATVNIAMHERALHLGFVADRMCMRFGLTIWIIQT